MCGLNMPAWSFKEGSVVNAVVRYPDPSPGPRHSFPQQVGKWPADGSQISPLLRIVI